MPRKPVLSVDLNRKSSVSLQEQLSTGLKSQILTGSLAAGDALPSSRELARDLGLSRNTVVAACDRLLGEGYLEARTRSGLFVSPQLAAPRGAPQKTQSAARMRPTLANDGQLLSDPIPFRPCRPDARLFPLARWNRHRNRVLRKYGMSLLHYQPTCGLGLPALRQALAEYLEASRGVKCDWTQVAITCGSQQALFLLGQLLIKPGDRVYVEDPGYHGARAAFAHARARIESLAVDGHGVVRPRSAARAALFYTTPSRQFPTGATQPAARRMQLLEAVRKADAWLIEDDYDSEFRYSRPPLPSLHSLDQSGRVIYLGSMSKVLCSSLRIGYVVLPAELIESFERLRMVVDEHGPLVDQATLASFISSGDFYAHLRRSRKAYAGRLEAFLAGVRRHGLPLDFPFVDGGMNQAGFFADPEVDATLVSRQLARHGFDVPATAQFALRPTRPALLFGFTAFDEPALARHLTALSRIWPQAASK